MGAQLGLPDALRARGLTVEVVPGWETRSAGSFNPKGAICHWTAGPAKSTTRPSLSICTKGRADLPGPLCNVYLDRNGVAVVVAAGRANHAGAGSWRGVTGNSSFFGTECEAAGPDDFTAAQRWAYPRVNAAYADLGGFGADMVAGHSEYATPKGRKQDINGYTMTNMRADTASVLAGQHPTSPLQETFMAGLSDVEQRDLYNRIMGRDVQRYLTGGPDLNSFQVHDQPVPGSWPARSADVADVIGLLKTVATGDARTVAEVSSAFHQEADRDAANQAAVLGQIAALGTDPAQIAETLRVALGSSLAREVVAELGHQLTA